MCVSRLFIRCISAEWVFCAFFTALFSSRSAFSCPFHLSLSFTADCFYLSVAAFSCFLFAPFSAKTAAQKYFSAPLSNTVFDELGFSAVFRCVFVRIFRLPPPKKTALFFLFFRIREERFFPDARFFCNFLFGIAAQYFLRSAVCSATKPSFFLCGKDFVPLCCPLYCPLCGKGASVCCMLFSSASFILRNTFFRTKNRQTACAAMVKIQLIG